MVRLFGKKFWSREFKDVTNQIDEISSHWLNVVKESIKDSKTAAGTYDASLGDRCNIVIQRIESFIPEIQSFNQHLDQMEESFGYYKDRSKIKELEAGITALIKKAVGEMKTLRSLTQANDKVANEIIRKVKNYLKQIKPLFRELDNFAKKGRHS